MPATAEAQIEFLRWALHLANPRIIIETGTHKGLFGYLVSVLMKDVVIHTLDVHSGAAKAAELADKQAPGLFGRMAQVAA